MRTHAPNGVKYTDSGYRIKATLETLKAILKDEVCETVTSMLRKTYVEERGIETKTSEHVTGYQRDRRG